MNLKRLVTFKNKYRIRQRPRGDYCSTLFVPVSSWQQQQSRYSNHALVCNQRIHLDRYGPLQRFDHHRRSCRALNDHFFGHRSQFSRYLATDSNFGSTSTPSDLLSVYRQTTERLLNTPVGTFNVIRWKEAHATILSWLNSCLNETESKTNATFPSRLVASESIHRAFELLDRMFQEEQEVTKSQNGKIPKVFDHELLNLVLNRTMLMISSRMLLLEEHQQGPKGDPQTQDFFLVDPKHLLNQLYKYRDFSSRLQPDIQSYSIFLNMIASLVVQYNEYYDIEKRKDLMATVDEIVDSVVDLACHDYDNHAILGNSGDALDMSDIKDQDSRQEQDELHSLKAPAPNVVLFSSAMNAWIKSGLYGAAERVEDLLERMITLREQYPEWDIAPNEITYSTVIDAWSKEMNIEKIQDLLQRMYQNAAEQNNPSLRPGLRAFNGYLVALAKLGRVEEAEDLLGRMEDMYTSGELDEPPGVVNYTTVIDGFARSKLDGAAMRAESFLRRMMERDDLSPNVVTYNSVLNVHMKSFNIGAAESLLQEMYERFLQTGNMDIRPNTQSYSIVLSGIAKNRQRDAGERAEKILDQMIGMARSGDLDEPPDTISYNIVLDCWAKSSSRFEDASRAVAFLEKMKRNNITPDVISYNTVVHCLAKSGRLKDAELMLDQMKEAGVDPNTITYNSLLAASRNANIAQVEKIFEKMLNDPSITPDVVSYNTMLKVYSVEGDIEKLEILLNKMFFDESVPSPDATSMNTVINALSRSGRHDAPQRAETILEQMLQANDPCQEGAKPIGITPTSATFNSVMTAWNKTRKRESAERCQYLFDLMTNNEVAKIQPDIFTYNIMLHAWSLSNRKDAPNQAEALFHEMNKKYKAGNSRLRPNTKTFGSLINVWSKSHLPEAGQKADGYLRKIIEIDEGKQNLYHQNSRSLKENQPRVYEFTATIKAWYKSRDPMAPYKADEVLYMLLQQVKKGNKKALPDAHIFIAVLQTLVSSTIPKKYIYADRLVNLMIKFKIEPNKILMDLLLRCYSDLRQESTTLNDSSECELKE